MKHAVLLAMNDTMCDAAYPWRCVSRARCAEHSLPKASHTIHESQLMEFDATLKDGTLSLQHEPGFDSLVNSVVNSLVNSLVTHLPEGLYCCHKQVFHARSSRNPRTHNASLHMCCVGMMFTWLSVMQLERQL